MLRMVYINDLHSDIDQYQDVKKRLLESNADCLVIGGDLFEHSREMTPQLQFCEDFLLDFFTSIRVPIFIIHGNTDWPGAIKRLTYLLRDQGHITFLDLDPTHFGNIKLLGYPISNLSPFARKDDEKRDLAEDSLCSNQPIFISNSQGESIRKDPHYFNELPSMEEDLNQIKDPQTIWVMHAPPYGTKLDMIRGGEHVGSKAIRNRMEDIQPLLTLHGHIHESPYVSGGWIDRIGHTICINPGRGKELHAVTIDFDGHGKILAAKHSIFGEINLSEEVKHL